MKNNQIFLILVLLVIVGGGAFYGGMKYQESKQTSLSQQGCGGGNLSNGTRGGMGRSLSSQNGNRNGGFRPVNGEIINADDKSITVKLQDGSSRIVLINDKTVINKAEIATKADLKTGEKVAVFGSTNTDGSVSAQNIQLNPIGRMMGGTPQTTPSGTK